MAKSALKRLSVNFWPLFVVAVAIEEGHFLRAWCGRKHHIYHCNFNTICYSSEDTNISSLEIAIAKFLVITYQNHFTS